MKCTLHSKPRHDVYRPQHQQMKRSDQKTHASGVGCGQIEVNRENMGGVPPGQKLISIPSAARASAEIPAEQDASSSNAENLTSSLGRIFPVRG